MTYSLESPKPGGTFAAASAAFVRLHERRVEEETLKEWEKRERAAGNWWGTHGASRVELEEGQTHRVVEQWVPRRGAHQAQGARGPAGAARGGAQHARRRRTEYDEVQERLVDMREQATRTSGAAPPRAPAAAAVAPAPAAAAAAAAASPRAPPPRA